MIKRPRKYCYTKADIAKWSGRSIWTVKRDIREETLDAGNVFAVMEYIKKHGGKGEAADRDAALHGTDSSDTK